MTQPAFHMNRWILQNKFIDVSNVVRSWHFESVVLSVACFAGRPSRCVCNRQLEHLNTYFRKLRKSIVGPPPGTDCTHEWLGWTYLSIETITWTNDHVSYFVKYWKWPHHCATPPQELWVRRMLRWCRLGWQQHSKWTTASGHGGLLRK